MPENIDVEALKKEVEELKQRNADLEGQVSQLQNEVILNNFYCAAFIQLCMS